MSNADNTMIITAFQDLFSHLSAWEPDGDLLLDISVHSLSDSEHWFKYLTFEPDNDSNAYGRVQHIEQSLLFKASDHHHGWITGRQPSIPSYAACHKPFDEIMGEGPFDNEQEEYKWWQQLPLVPAVTGVLLRQQNRRRWKPDALAHMFARLPGLRQIHYEPWREWDNIIQRDTDQVILLAANNLLLFVAIALRYLFESLASNRLRRLVLFENFNQAYPASFENMGCDPVRIPSSHVSRAVANASLSLEHVSASFLVDASHFFHARELSWKWPNLTWLALTSRLLAPGECSMELDDMLQAAAAAAMKMPNLEVMEIWNGGKGLAMLFRYRRPERGLPAVITWRGTWKLTLRRPVIEAWDSVARRHGGQGHSIAEELLDAGASVKSHGDAICRLKLSRPVIRPVSLRQIQIEHMMSGV
ncbi:hypothetical protein RJ55_06769 [Drechmeria coniospora]|nr:hypothetical protein RJ55_06769 [Drechmeria coniospora]